MIKFVTITNNKNEELKIDIYNSVTTGMNIRKIDGLGPVKANIITTPIVTNDGDIFNSARADKRNIVLTLGFKITPEIGLNTIEDVRQKTYNFFPLKTLVKITIETDNRELYTYGYVESNEPDIFSKDETCIVSLICPDSYFTSEYQRNMKLDQLKSVFKFPFEVRIEDLPDIDLFNTEITYFQTKDTQIDLKKDYYKRNGQEGEYTYELVTNPELAYLPYYYEQENNKIQNIIENQDLGDVNNGNLVFELYDYYATYFDLETKTYNDIKNIFYENIKILS